MNSNCELAVNVLALENNDKLGLKINPYAQCG